MKGFIVAIDGPAGSGKSTIAKLIAKKYNFTYLDTGAMYRMITLYILENGIDCENEVEIKKVLEETKIDIIGGKFYLNGVDVSEKIRGVAVTEAVSKISAIKRVREKLVELQREISLGKMSVLDGRDIGTVVFPNADVKIFLVASAEERAKRRLKEFEEKGEKLNYDEVLTSIKDRDYKDTTRSESPLVKGDDALEIDSSFLTIEDVVNKISECIDKKLKI